VSLTYQPCVVVSTPYGRREKGEVSYERREREREKKGKEKTKGREK
jgi:lipocalin